MTQVAVEYHGIHVMEPEQFLCAVLRWPAAEKIVPVWMSPLDGGQVAARSQGYEPTRPDTYDLLFAALESLGGVDRIEVTGYHEGVFMVDITTGHGETMEARMSDAIVLSTHFSVAIEFEEDLLAQVAIYVPPQELAEYFELRFDDATESTAEQSAAAGESASGNAQADADFSEMMRSLGISEEDLLGAGSDDVADFDGTDEPDGDDGTNGESGEN